MNILDQIVKVKRSELDLRKKQYTLAELSSLEFYSRQPLSAVKSLTSAAVPIIAEHKRKSPSKGFFNTKLELKEVLKMYQDSNAAVISILTDQEFFAGNLEDLLLARNMLPTMPLLRKDFIIDAYQLTEAKAYGADLVLLIARILDPKQQTELASEAKALGLEVLLEVHNLEELERSDLSNIDIVGVNNRDLDNFSVSLNTSLELANRIPSNLLKISESGIKSAADLCNLYKAGYRGFLIGESFMKTDNPGYELKKFIDEAVVCLAK